MVYGGGVQIRAEVQRYTNSAQQVYSRVYGGFFVRVRARSLDVRRGVRTIIVLTPAGHAPRGGHAWRVLEDPITYS